MHILQRQHLGTLVCYPEFSTLCVMKDSSRSTMASRLLYSVHALIARLVWACTSLCGRLSRTCPGLPKLHLGSKCQLLFVPAHLVRFDLFIYRGRMSSRAWQFLSVFHRCFRCMTSCVCVCVCLIYNLTRDVCHYELRFDRVDVLQGRLPETHLSSPKFVCNKGMPMGIKMCSMLWHVSYERKAFFHCGEVLTLLQ